MESIKRKEILDLVDELYVCLSRREREKIQILSHYCDKHVIRFYFVPLSVELLDIHLKRELLDDMELFTTHEILLDNPVNKAIKRIFDIVTSCIILLCFIPLFPFVALIIHIQSPGPIFFRQKRTGINGCDFVCYKFRSMHVNNEADTIQATENDPRKFPFGDFMRKCNIDEMPQFWNVLKGDMSIVGPRPHMLYHTDLYRQLINDYMVRHFVKPGITGWAQVTGFRGETKELWQMEERVKRDIWYMEHWSVWLDLRIIWMTFKTIFIHDEQAY
jgi:putative colanic acid biosynthesis UDP-glucose lipid carrier transferase